MRRFAIALCVFAAACSGNGRGTPTSPTAAPQVAGVDAQGGTHLPFSGSLTGGTSATFVPPTTLEVTSDLEGTANELGRFTASGLEVVDTTTATSTGNLTFVAANGDELFTRTVGREIGFTPPNISMIQQEATIIGGTGRFAGASGTFTIDFVQVIDFSAGTASLTGSFKGHIDRNK